MSYSTTEGHRRALLQALMDAWARAPHLRFGQMLEVVTGGDDLFPMSDLELRGRADAFVDARDKERR